jgi:hypothetical protein
MLRATVLTFGGMADLLGINNAIFGVLIFVFLMVVTACGGPVAYFVLRKYFNAECWFFFSMGSIYITIPIPPVLLSSAGKIDRL